MVLQREERKPKVSGIMNVLRDLIIAPLKILRKSADRPRCNIGEKN